MEIRNGALLLQVSNDGNTGWVTWDKRNLDLDKAAGWKTQVEITKSPKAAYLNKGCFIRAVLLYELLETYSYKNYAEIYTFYIYRNAEDHTDEIPSGQSFVLGRRYKTSEGFSHQLEVQQGDPHLGWKLGQFVISGFTEHREAKDPDQFLKDRGYEIRPHIFLKNVGDEIRLGFRLEQDIDELNGNPNLKITSDQNTTDLLFELPLTNFARGMLIIQQTDYRNNTPEPAKHENFLEAEVRPFTDTQIGLYEEGNYILKLDYSIGSNHYTIVDSFWIRNSNCMVYVFDTRTTSELLDGSYTDTGFYLDLAFSRYLKINVECEALINGRWDMRYNKSASDLEPFTEPGVYTITVTNEVTGEMTVKTIYVGWEYRELWEDYWKK